VPPTDPHETENPMSSTDWIIALFVIADLLLLFGIIEGRRP
jgi:hypothetical protein